MKSMVLVGFKFETVPMQEHGSSASPNAVLFYRFSTQQIKYQHEKKGVRGE